MCERNQPDHDGPHELTDDELALVVGGGLLSSPLGTRLLEARVQGHSTREIVEDVEAY